MLLVVPFREGLGLATSFAFVVGMAEGARVSDLKGDIKFPFRYAIYNTIPSFVGGKVPPSSVASAMITAPPLRSCPRAAAQVMNLRALRTAVAGCTVLSIMFQISLAGGRGADAYERAVAEGREIPSLSSRVLGNMETRSTQGVVRLCGTGGLELALVAARRGGQRTPILPVVISGGAGCRDCNPTSLPEGALALVAMHSPRPCYYRVDSGRLFCRDVWQPVSSAISDAAAGLKGREIVFVVEADTLSSDTPQTLLTSPVVKVTECMGSDKCKGIGRLGEDQALWGSTMLRKALEEKGPSGRVASVVLGSTRVADVDKSTVSIDGRAALLLSVLSWAQRCAAESIEKVGTTVAPSSLIPTDTTVVETVTEDGAAEVEDTVADSAEGTVKIMYEKAKVVATVTNSGQEGEGVTSLYVVTLPKTAARLLGVLEKMGTGVRRSWQWLGVITAPDEHLQSTLRESTGAVFKWLDNMIKLIVDGGNQVLIYDTDDDESFRWLADQMFRQGWTVKRGGGHHGQQSVPETKLEKGALSLTPVLVHHCSDEKTLTAAACHLARGPEGPPVCVVVHRWDCRAEARRLLLGARAGQHRSIEVICAAEVGEGFFQFARGQLQEGVKPTQVQVVLDNLFRGFY